MLPGDRVCVTLMIPGDRVCVTPRAPGGQGALLSPMLPVRPSVPLGVLVPRAQGIAGGLWIFSARSPHIQPEGG